MPIHPGTLLRDALRRPIPPQWLLERLQREHHGIGVFYSKGAWVVTEAWKETDPRRARIQAGDMDPQMAFDICGSLPVTVDLPEVPGFLNQMLVGISRDKFTQIRDAVNKWNTFSEEGQDAVILDTVLDQVLGGSLPGVSAGIFGTGGFNPGDETTAAIPKPDFDLSNVPNMATTSPAILASLERARAEKKRLRDERANAEPVSV